MVSNSTQEQVEGKEGSDFQNLDSIDLSPQSAAVHLEAQALAGFLNQVAEDYPESRVAEVCEHLKAAKEGIAKQINAKTAIDALKVTPELRKESEEAMQTNRFLVCKANHGVDAKIGDLLGGLLTEEGGNIVYSQLRGYIDFEDKVPSIYGVEVDTGLASNPVDCDGETPVVKTNRQASLRDVTLALATLVGKAKDLEVELDCLPDHWNEDKINYVGRLSRPELEILDKLQNGFLRCQGAYFDIEDGHLNIAPLLQDYQEPKDSECWDVYATEKP